MHHLPLLFGLLFLGCTSAAPRQISCERVLRARCAPRSIYISCALESYNFSRLDLPNLMTPVLDGVMVCGPWVAP